MKRIAILAVTHGHGLESSPAQWNVAPMTELPSGDTIHPTGEAAFSFMSQFDIVFNWHWPSSYMVRSLAEVGTTVIPFLEIDAIKTYREWSPINEMLRRMFIGPLGGRHIRNKLNEADEAFVRPYEKVGPPWDEKPHAWSIDMDYCSGRRFHIEYARQVAAIMETMTHPPRFVAVDSADRNQYFGQATNVDVPSLPRDWGIWRMALERHACPVWGHGALDVPEFQYAVSEHMLTENWADIIRMIQLSHSSKRFLALSVLDGAQLSRFRTLQQMGFAIDGVVCARSGFISFNPEVG